MNIILLSGGSGKRLWPLSNDVRSKQFLKLISDENGVRQSMAQRVYSQIVASYPNANIVIATAASQSDLIRSQLTRSTDIVLEPERRDTFPAILLSTAYLVSKKGITLDDPVIALPIDTYAEQKYFEVLKTINGVIKADHAQIALMGIKPEFPASKFGYILANETLGDAVYRVARFIEKPDEKTACELIELGAYWNGGVFCFKPRYISDMVEDFAYEKIYENYRTLEKISFDYKVVENAKNVAVVPYDGLWDDVGTWTALTKKLDKNVIGSAVLEDSLNVYAVNELDIPIVTLGVKNLIVAASADGILVSDLSKSSNLKALVDKLII